jgi:hypothetical protein
VIGGRPPPSFANAREAGTAEPSDAVPVVKRKRQGQCAAKRVPYDEWALEPERAAQSSLSGAD